MDTPWMTVREAADYTRRHEKTVLRALRRDDLRGFQPGANATWRIHKEDVDAWMRGERPKTRRAA